MAESDPIVPKQDDRVAPKAACEQAYEAPSIEMVLTADELEREVLYAGVVTL